MFSLPTIKLLKGDRTTAKSHTMFSVFLRIMEISGLARKKKFTIDNKKLKYILLLILDIV